MAGPLTRAYWTSYVAFLAKRETAVPFLPRERLEKIQAERIRSLVRYAADQVPYYRDWLAQAGANPRDIRTASDLARLPLISKGEMLDSPESFLARGMAGRDGLTMLSSGTGGRRRTFRYDARALFEAYAKGRRRRLALSELIGPEAGYREAVIAREGGAADQLRSFWTSRLLTVPGIELTRCMIPANHSFPEILDRLNTFRPVVIRGYGSHLGAFFRWVGECGRPFKKPRAIAFGGDAMTEAHRSFIECELGVPVISNYQAVEALRIGFECHQRRGFHTSIDQVVLRVVDQNGLDVSPGEQGEVVLSNLTNYGTVVLNYRLGDLATVSGRACACGRTMPLIESVDGRLEDLLIRKDGSSVHALTVIPSLQAVAGVHQVQIVQLARDSYILRVVWAPGVARDVDELARRLRCCIQEQVHVRVEATERLETTALGKMKTVIRTPACDS